MAYRKARKSSSGKARRKSYTGTKKRSTRSSSASKKRGRVKAATRASGGTVKLVIEHAAGSPVARPDGLAGAFQVPSKAGRARL